MNNDSIDLEQLQNNWFVRWIIYDSRRHMKFPKKEQIKTENSSHFEWEILYSIRWQWTTKKKTEKKRKRRHWRAALKSWSINWRNEKIFLEVKHKSTKIEYQQIVFVYFRSKFTFAFSCVLARNILSSCVCVCVCVSSTTHKWKSVHTKSADKMEKKTKSKSNWKEEMTTKKNVRK